jgi:ABC-2 type transport system ATP-binding protein
VNTERTDIEVVDLVKRFGSVTAVDHLSFTARPGRVTGFLGPNGSGKSTTLRALLGLVSPTQGTALIGGRPFRELADPVATVGAVLEPSFHPTRTARDHLQAMAAAARLSRTRVEQVLEEVDIARAAHRRVGGFSLGMRQRLGLAGALLGDPQVLVLDEPANGLDPAGMSWLRRFLRGLAAEGRTVLLSSHVLSEMAHTIDDAVVIAEGRLVRQATLSDLLDASDQMIRIQTPAAEPLRDALAADNVSASLDAADVVVIRGASAEQVGDTALRVGAPIYEMTTDQADLETTFLQLTTSGGVR